MIWKHYLIYLFLIINEPFYRFTNFDSKQRFEIFQENIKSIINHNLDPKSSYKMGINHFTGLSKEEISGLFASQNCSATALLTLKNAHLKKRNGNIKIPSSIDWRTQGIVSPVKNQGSCGSCWTFSTTGCLESHMALKTKSSPPSLSEQQLVDCAGAFDNHGCNGGLPSHAFEYIKYSKGINSEYDYPYEGVDRPCRYKTDRVNATVPGGSVNITAYNETELLVTVGTVGPVSIAFQVASDFHFYSGGVYSSNICKNGPQDVNHAVLVVGYGNENGTDYWIIKNSWGESWGEKGYFRMQRGVNMCGIADCASYPDVYGY